MGSFTLPNDASGTFQSSMLEDFAFAGEIAGESDVSVVELGPGLGYAPLFVGQSGSVVYVAPDSSAPEGWSQELLPDGLSPSQVVGCVDAGGTPTVFAIGPDLSSPDLQMTTRGSGGAWSGWAPIATGASVPDVQIAELLVDGSSLYAILEDDSAWLVEWTGTPATWTAMGDALPGLVAPATVEVGGSPVRGLAVAQSDGVALDLVFLPPAPGAPVPLAQGVNFNLLAASKGASGSSLVFVADKGAQTGTPNVSMLDGSTPQTVLVHRKLDRAAMPCSTGAGGGGS